MKYIKLAAATAVALLPFYALADSDIGPGTHRHGDTGQDHHTMHDQLSDKPWEFYGALYLALQHNDPGKVADHDGNQPDSNLWLNSEGTTLGFRGTVPLHHGLKGVWQIESLVNIDQFGDPPTAHTHGTQPATYNDSELAGGHNSFLGLAGKWGTFLGGKHNTPFFDATLQFDLFHHLAGDVRSVMGRLPGVESGSGDHHGGTFNVSASNTLMYKTPDYNGLSAEVAYFGLNETRVNVSDKPRSYGANVRYGQRSYTVVAAYEAHDNYDTYADAPGETIDTVQGMMAGGMINFFDGQTIVGAFYEQLKTDDDSALIPDDKRSGYYVNLRQKITPRNAIHVAYGVADDFVGNDGGAMLALGLFHDIGPTSQVYAVYAGTDNETGSNFSTGAVGPLNNGGDPSTIAVGAMYHFQ